MFGVVRIHIDEVHSEIAPQGLSSILVQPVSRSLGFFKHDKRCARHDVGTIPVGTASGKAIYEVELELIVRRVNIQPVKIGTEVSPKNV